MPSAPFTIAVDKRFDHLNKAPIVEAVVAINAVANREWKPDLICEEVKKAVITRYPKISEQRQFQGQVSFDKVAVPKSTVSDLGCMGYRAISKDDKYIAQFNKGSFAVSRLKPYEDWEKFISEAISLWNIYREIMKPSLIERIGVRFINLIDFPLQGQLSNQLSDYLQQIPVTPVGLNMSPTGFISQVIYQIPEKKYSIRILTTIQPIINVIRKEGIVIDIDVFSSEPNMNEYKEDMLTQKLQEMRCLKNNAFFESITPKLLEVLK